MDAAAEKYDVAFFICVPNEKGADYNIVNGYDDPTTTYFYVIRHDDDDLLDALIFSAHDNLSIKSLTYLKQFVIFTYKGI